MLLSLSREMVRQELYRFAPFGEDTFTGKGYGVINIDLAMYFPHANQDEAYCDFILSRAKDPNAYDFALWMSAKTTEGICNHRYANQDFITYSRQDGKKRCKTGYPVYGPVEELNQYSRLVVRFGVGDARLLAIFPISVHLTKEKPWCGLTVAIDYDTPAINVLETHAIPNDPGGEVTSYSLAPPEQENQTPDDPPKPYIRFVSLTATASAHREAAMVKETIVLNAQATDHFFL